ncbi:MAG: pyruvoyl-dependent arginine decarboxylase [Candidatus Saliniplasma sp.]
MIKEFKHFTVRKGIGKNDISALNAIDKAYHDAGICDFNLIRVSSILPNGIERVDEIYEEFGSFLPCVLAEAVGVKNEVAAGIGYGFDDEGGGYVAEHSLFMKDIDMDEFDDQIKKKVREMGHIRDINIPNIHVESIKTDINEAEFGCSVAVLVYLP